MVASSLFVDFEVFEKDATAGIANVKINKTIKIPINENNIIGKLLLLYN